MRHSIGAMLVMGGVWAGCAREPVDESSPVAPARDTLVLAQGEPNRPSCVDRPASGVTALDVEGFAPAAVVAPELRCSVRLPVLVVAHGNFDRPEWECEVFAPLVEGRALVVCPRGDMRSDSPPGDPRFHYRGERELADEVAATLAAIAGAYGDLVDVEKPVLAGFSQGAFLGMPLFGPRVSIAGAVLVEGGHDRWTADTARAFVDAGGERVFFACGQPDCAKAAGRPQRLLAAAGARTRMEHVVGVGHRLDARLQAEVRKAIRWVTETDPRWRTVPEGAQM